MLVIPVIMTHGVVVDDVL